MGWKTDRYLIVFHGNEQVAGRARALLGMLLCVRVVPSDVYRVVIRKNYLYSEPNHFESMHVSCTIFSFLPWRRNK